jgi:hypothetical protein
MIMHELRNSIITSSPRWLIEVRLFVNFVKVLMIENRPELLGATSALVQWRPMHHIVIQKSLERPMRKTIFKTRQTTLTPQSDSLSG